MNTTWIIPRLIGVGFALALGSFAQARETTLDLFRPTAILLTAEQTQEVVAYLKYLDRTPSPSDKLKRIFWFGLIARRMPAVMMRLEPLDYSAELGRIAGAMGAVDGPSYGELMLARLALEMSRAGPPDRLSHVRGLLAAALNLPFDERARPMLDRLVKHVLENSAWRISNLRVIRANPQILDRSPATLKLIFDYAVHALPGGKVESTNEAALRVLFKRPGLLRVEQIQELEGLKAKAKRLELELVPLIDALVARIYGEADHSRVTRMKGTFATTTKVGASHRRAVNALLKAVAEPKPARVLERAQWWSNVTRLITPAIMKYDVVDGTRHLANLFGSKPATKIRFGRLVVKGLLAEFKSVGRQVAKRDERLQIILEATWSLPEDRSQRSALRFMIHDLLGDHLTRTLALDFIRHNPTILRSLPPVYEEVVALALDDPGPRLGLQTNLSALEALKALPSVVRPEHIEALARFGRRMIEGHWDQRQLQKKFELRHAFEDFGLTLERELNLGSRYLDRIRGAAVVSEPKSVIPTAIIQKGIDGLRIHEAEFKPSELVEIEEFLRYAEFTAPEPGTTDYAYWWERLARRVPESIMNVEVVGVPTGLANVIAPVRPPPGTLLGDLLIASLFTNLHSKESRLSSRQAYVRTMLEAAFNFPVHVVTLRNYGHYVVGLLQDESLREATLNALLLHPKVLRLSRPIRDEVLRIAGYGEDEGYGAEDTSLAWRALAAAPDALADEHVGGLPRASRQLEARPWTADAMNEVIDSVHSLMIAVRTGSPVTCDQVLSTTRW